VIKWLRYIAKIVPFEKSMMINQHHLLAGYGDGILIGALGGNHI
jgi:hypothetical protein